MFNETEIKEFGKIDQPKPTSKNNSTLEGQRPAKPQQRFFLAKNSSKLRYTLCKDGSWEIVEVSAIWGEMTPEYTTEEQARRDWKNRTKTGWEQLLPSQI